MFVPGAMAATCARADTLSRQGTEGPDGIVELASLFCGYARERIERNFRRARKNQDASGYRLAQRIGAGEFTWLEEGGAVVAVGALHLPGADGIVELLRAEGLRVTPVAEPPLRDGSAPAAGDAGARDGGGSGG